MAPIQFFEEASSCSTPAGAQCRSIPTRSTITGRQVRRVQLCRHRRLPRGGGVAVLQRREDRALCRGSDSACVVGQPAAAGLIDSRKAERQHRCRCRPSRSLPVASAMRRWNARSGSASRRRSCSRGHAFVGLCDARRVARRWPPAPPAPRRRASNTRRMPIRRLHELGRRAGSGSSSTARRDRAGASARRRTIAPGAGATAPVPLGHQHAHRLAQHRAG